MNISTIIILAAVGFVMGIILTITIKQHLDNDARKNKDLQWYRSKYLVKNGYLQPFGNYYLVSLDGGKHWYDVTRDTNGLTINGPADQALLDAIDGMDNLIKYVERNGAIGSRPIVNEDIKVLQGAGFTVTRKE